MSTTASKQSRKSKSVSSTVRTQSPDTLLRRLPLAAAALIAALFVYQAYRSTLFYLNPDEALHYQLAHQPSLGDAYRASNSNAQPPLLVVTLYFWTALGHSEPFLRLIPLIAYCGFLWFFFQWMRLVAGDSAAIAATLLAAFAPSMSALAIEVRHYTPLL